jgi:hypothetical protein
VADLLAGADMETVTMKSVLTRLQTHFETDLSSRKDMIKDAVRKVIQGS